MIYEQGTSTGCGFGQSAMGPFYCPNDKKVYLDLAFWQEMETQLGASGADFAHAYVLAHEIGHHVQTMTGASEQVQRAQQQASSEAEGNRYSVALELQADCYAGVWAANAASVSGGEVAVEQGDLEEGLQHRLGHRRRHPAAPFGRAGQPRKLHPRVVGPADGMAAARLSVGRPGELRHLPGSVDTACCIAHGAAWSRRALPRPDPV